MEFLKRIALAFFFICWAASAASAAGISLGGDVTNSAQLTSKDLQALPPTNVAVSMMTGNGQETGTYTGALLWTVLSNAGIVGEPKAHLLRTIIVTGSDGYQVALAIGEIDPKFEGKQVIIAYAKDGRPLDIEDGLRLIVPGDQHGGRAVKDVMHIEVK